MSSSICFGVLICMRKYMYIYLMFYTLSFSLRDFPRIFYAGLQSEFCLYGQKSNGFYPKLEVAFTYWQRVAYKVRHIGHLLSGFQNTSNKYHSH